jgi:hypothetical protein
MEVKGINVASKNTFMGALPQEASHNFNNWNVF